MKLQIIKLIVNIFFVLIVFKNGVMNLVIKLHGQNAHFVELFLMKMNY